MDNFPRHSNLSSRVLPGVGEADKPWAMNPVQRDRGSQGIPVACFVSSRLLSNCLFAHQKFVASKYAVCMWLQTLSFQQGTALLKRHLWSMRGLCLHS